MHKPALSSGGRRLDVSRTDKRSVRGYEGARVEWRGAGVGAAGGVGRGDRRSMKIKSMAGLHLFSTWQDWRATSLSGCPHSRSSFLLSRGGSRRSSSRSSSLHHNSPIVVDEIGGEYQESFDDVDKHLIDYFTYKAVKTVLAQLYEMNPQQYAWFYNFVVSHKPQDSKTFLRVLVSDRQELGERVMVTRLHLFRRWAKKYSHAEVNDAIANQNLELLRERLMQIVKLTPDGDDPRERPLKQ
ncbi:hypothetical protein CBR_g21098 [Chara braunii]|uniref:Chaperonin-like RbcX protein n=1 Tax=Chara braunii TaxID=69332 RepID=A0A388L0K8_CHABU|nr:hypothetical protein CBR_g21098 [Chara braunii]|eukprot:GBG75854.1 hypothetical protein CBR_g21098 [Chara braunii]